MDELVTKSLILSSSIHTLWTMGYHTIPPVTQLILNISWRPYFTDTTSNYTTQNSTAEVEVDTNWSVLSLIVIIIATTIGNILVCLAVCWEKRLQNMTNYFLMSLAIADLLVSILVMPLGMVIEMYGKCILYLSFCSSGFISRHILKIDFLPNNVLQIL